jgi:DNA-binding response OmpR family regulator
MLDRPDVLIIDSDPSDCLFASTTLKQAGYTIDVALNRQHALAKIMMSHPKCLLLDVFLLDGSGYAFCRYIRQSIPENKLPIILTSTKASPIDQNYGLSQGAQRYLLKPFTAESLVQTVWEIIPEPFRANHPALQQQRPHLKFDALVPHRITNQDEMRTRNPFSYAALKNAQIRQVYTTINGKKTVHELSQVTGLHMKEISQALRVLVKENYIRLYDATGKPVEDSDL